MVITEKGGSMKHWSWRSDVWYRRRISFTTFDSSLNRHRLQQEVQSISAKERRTRRVETSRNLENKGILSIEAFESLFSWENYIFFGLLICIFQQLLLNKLASFLWAKLTQLITACCQSLLPCSLAQHWAEIEQCKAMYTTYNQALW